MDRIIDCDFGKKVTIALKFQNVQIKKTDSQADYASLIGFDSKDLIEVKIWNLPQNKKDIIKNGNIYICEGLIKNYQGKKQLNVSEFREALDNEVDFEEFYEYAPLTKKELQTKISEYILKIKNELIKKIVFQAIKKYQTKFFEYPAAVSIHHNYISGLAYHTYSMLNLADTYLKQYTYLNSDLVYAGIIIHDMGKVKELSDSRTTTYTNEGNLLGHISLGANMLNEICKEIGCENSEEALVLEHIILSHHGKNEYGSPKEPMIAEAALIFLLDYTDSRFASLEKYIRNAVPGENTEPISSFEKKCFYIPNIKKE